VPQWLKVQLANRGLFWQGWKFVWSLTTALVFTFIYFPASEMTKGRSHNLMTALDHAIPFIPWTWWIYFPGYLAGVIFAIFALRDTRIVYRTCIAMMVVQVMSVSVYMLLPSTFPRPTDWQGTGLTADAIYWFWAFDPPNNTFPSTHCAVSLLATLALWRERNPYTWVSALATLGVILTVHTTKQHYWIDAVGGVMCAWIAHRVVFDWWAAFRGKQPIYPLPERVDPDAPGLETLTNPPI